MSRTRIVSYVDDELLKSLNKLCENSKTPLSHIISELIDIGCRVKQHHDTHPDQQKNKKAELVDKHTEYLLKIMAIAIDIYRCVRNEKSKYTEETIEGALAKISTNTQGFINRKLREV